MDPIQLPAWPAIALVSFVALKAAVSLGDLLREEPDRRYRMMLAFPIAGMMIVVAFSSTAYGFSPMARSAGFGVALLLTLVAYLLGRRGVIAVQHVRIRSRR